MKNCACSSSDNAACTSAVNGTDCPTGQPRIAVLGNPNCGKTTLFNALTGLNQYVGNWPGVTVEKKTGQLILPVAAVELVDLPGIYSLDNGESQDSMDEQIARRYLLQNKPDLLLNIVDASQLERNLYLTLQLLELGLPTILVLNKADSLAAQGRSIDPQALSRELGCPVLLISARSRQGLEALQQQLSQALAEPQPATPPQLPLAAPLQQAVDSLASQLDLVQQDLAQQETAQLPAASQALRLLENDPLLPVSEHITSEAARLAADAEQQAGADIDLLVADARYQRIEQISRQAVSDCPAKRDSLSSRLDRLLLNRFIGLPVFLLVMYLMFVFTIHVGGAFIDFFDIAAGALFVESPAQLLAGWGAPGWLTTFLTAGVGAGLQTVATFIPVVGALFIFQAYLEGSGYLSRAAFIVDRLMGRLGLPGKAFVPLIVGFGCSVPAVMATRTLETPRERILTSMMAPFMSCGARLPVYALFGVAFFAGQATDIVFALYLIGIAVALLTGLLLRHTLLRGNSSVSVMELPAYQWPTLRDVLLRTWQKLSSFIRDAGKVIVIAITVIGTLNSLGTDGSYGNEDSEKSVISYMARQITPVFEPMGISDENWPATVGIVTGLFAKEAVVGTLAAVYTSDEEADAEFSLLGSLGEALISVPENLAGLGGSLGDPLDLGLLEATDVETAAEEQEVDSQLFSQLRLYFGSQAAAFAYLLFILLYTPCLAVLGAMKRELGARWMWLSAGYSLLVAYVVATGFYQLAIFAAQPLFSTLWLAGLLLTMTALWWVLKRRGESRPAQPLATSQPAGAQAQGAK